MRAVDLTGAADLHCHFGPDPHRERSVTAVEAARQAAASGHAAVVLKSHDFPTPAVASVVQELVRDVRVFGGVCCDREVGGVNPSAVDAALRIGAKIVWLPTLTSWQDVASGAAQNLGVRGEGISVIDHETRELLAETREVMALAREYGAVLATGHISYAEQIAVARAFAERDHGGGLLVTHAMEPRAGPNLGLDECLILANLGALIELCAFTVVGQYATRRIGEIADLIIGVGADRCVIGSDCGQVGNPKPVDALQLFADALLTQGVSESDIRKMACSNPCELLGISAV